ncbi:MAG: chemotaxis protein CheX [Selenomonadaceae bacterium]|nr:chemotaxis protein CheX [Selenomonadaceae bacterium]
MDKKLIDLAVDSFVGVMPNLGFEEPRRLEINLKEKNVIRNGVTVKVGFIKQVKGCIICNLSADTAMFIASTMMGATVTEFNNIVKSAIREVANMLAARSAIKFAQLGFDVDITTPQLIEEENIDAEMSSEVFLPVETEVNGHPFNLFVTIENAAEKPIAKDNSSFSAE